MSEEILINSTVSEVRVALVENCVLQEVWLERASHHAYLGNIYKGRVSRILPGMQAAFIDIGLDRTGFLHASDMVQSPSKPQEAAGDGVTDPEPLPLIQELLREGTELLVQVLKDPMGSKGARLTTNLSIPSRFLVLLPNCDSVGVSVRIEDEAERERLKCIVANLRPPDDAHGYIVRTNAEGVDEFAILADMNYLRRAWQQLEARAATAGLGERVYEDLSLPLRVLRDLMHSKVERVRIDSEFACQQMQDFAGRFIPDWVSRIEFYSSDRPIFDVYDIEREISQALQSKTDLKSGGYLVIDQTEALITIDVNTGGYVGRSNQQETILKTNLEAAHAVARQLRLRNLGGIIIIDFIDMTETSHREQLLRALESALQRDHARTQVYGFTSLGLVEMTRKRTRESLGRTLCEPCPVCEGRGNLRTPETVSLAVFREIMRSGKQFDSKEMLVMAAPKVIDHVIDEQPGKLAELEQITGRRIRLQREEQYSQEQFDVVLL